MHRLYAAREKRLKCVLALTVHGPCLPPPPLKPCEWHQVRVVDHKLSANLNFPGYKPELFRPTAAFLDAHGGTFGTIDEMVDSLTKAEY